MQRLFILIVFFYLSALSAQNNDDKAVRLRVNNWSEVDSLIRTNNVLNSKIINVNGQIMLEGNKINDTLYLYIANRNQIDSLHCHYKTCSSFLDLYQQQRVKEGFLFNKLTPVKLYIKNHHLNLVYQYENGKIQTIDSIAYDTKRFPINISNHLLHHFKNKPINEHTIRKIKDFVSTHTEYKLRKTMVLFNNTQNILMVNLSKAKTNRINGFAGVAFEPETKKLIVEGELNTKLYNLTHHNETLTLRWRKNATTQNFKLFLLTPFLFSKSIFLQNNLLIDRKDTEQLNFFYKITGGWHLKKHILSIHYIIDNTLGHENEKKILLGTDYQYNFNRTYGLFGINALDASLSLGANNQKVYASDIVYQVKLFHSQYLSGKAQIFKSSGIQHSNILKNYDSDMGNTLVFSNEIQNLLHIKLAYAYKKNTSYFYLLSAYIKTKHTTNIVENYFNTGIGMRISKKNQILTLEFTKSIKLMQTAVNQGFTMYIRQEIKF